ncbi:MAG TPA: MoxR family ATPase [Kineosporiaceae bacterium]|nr:MoxR family ATPase [Kineosporiaceae bacterium]
MTSTDRTDRTDGGVPGAGWHIYRGTGRPHDGIEALPDPPPWRRFAPPGDAESSLPPPVPGSDEVIGSRPGVLARAETYRPASDVVDTVNAAVFLRRPLLVTGKPGTGKSTLGYSIAFELGLGPVLYWPVTSRATVTDALYRYDAIGRLQEANLQRNNPDAVPDIGRFLRLGPLGTALLPWLRPRVLLIDELDKSDIDLPNDLLNIFEEGQYDIPELGRLPAEQQPVRVTTDDRGSAVVDYGRVQCLQFPIVVITSNGEREFPPAFRRRCLSLYIQPPDAAKLREIVVAQLGEQALADNDDLLREFVATREGRDLATDQLLNLIFLASTGNRPGPELRERLTGLLLRPLGPS